MAHALPQRAPLTLRIKEANVETVGTILDKAIDFLLNVAPKIVPPETRDKAKLQKLREEICEAAPYLKDMSSTYQGNSSSFVAAMHVNLQADNAYFWRDEHGDLDCGVLDWGGFGRSPFCLTFIGCLAGATPDLLLAHEDGILQAFVDEYARCGGPLLDLKEVRLRFHLGYISFVYDSVQWLEREVYKETTREELGSFETTLDENFQGRWATRCRCQTLIYAFTYYVKRGDFKATFDEWARGAGKPYLQEYR